MLVIGSGLFAVVRISSFYLPRLPSVSVRGRTKVSAFLFHSNPLATERGKLRIDDHCS